MKQLKKITCKEVMEKIEIGSRMIVGGVAFGHFTKTTTYGDSVAIEGDFVAQDIKTGKQFTAPVLYLPTDTALSVQKRLDEREDQSECLEIKIDVSVVPSEKSTTGYTFLCSPLQTEETMNAKKAMLDTLSQSANLLLENKK